MRNKKKLLARIIMVLTAFAVLGADSYAQDGRVRVKFAKGATSATVKRVISGNDGVITFIARVRKGQRINFTVDGGSGLNIQFSQAGDQDYLFESGPGEPNEHIAKKSGDHYITVINRNRASSKVNLNLVIK